MNVGDNSLGAADVLLDKPIKSGARLLFPDSSYPEKAITKNPS